MGSWPDDSTAPSPAVQMTVDGQVPLDFYDPLPTIASVKTGDVDDGFVFADVILHSASCTPPNLVLGVGRDCVDTP